MFGSLDSLTKISTARSRSISAENVYGEPGRGGMAEVSDTPQPEVVRIGQGWGNNSCARELGQKWKVRPCITLAPAAVTTLMDVDGPGCIRHIWITVNEKHLRNIVLRMYWDGEEAPSVEVPLGDFFCNACLHTAQIVAVPINVNPTNGMNCYFPMPFARHAKITVENLLPDEGIDGFFYTINFEELDEPAGDAYFHARFNRTNPLRYGDDYTILDGVEGSGNFVGCYMTWQQNNNGWWARARSRCSLTATRNSRPSAAPAPRTISAEPGVSIKPSALRFSAIRSAGRTAPARVTASTASTCSMQFIFTAV